MPVPAEDAEGAALTPEGWRVLREQATVLVKTHFLPKGVDTPEKAIAIMLKGRELGIPPMYALSNIAVINGKPTAGAELMLALIYRDHGDDAVRITESTTSRCTVAYRRRGWPDCETFSFTVEDAQRAGLLGKDNWQHYPAAMLRARCISAVARLAFPDTIGGLYTPEEMGARMMVQSDAEEVIEAEFAPDVPPIRETRAHPRLDESPRKVPGSEPAGERQRVAIRKLANLLHEEIDLPGDLDSVQAANLIARLSRAFNALEPAERARRTRGNQPGRHTT
jgi:hypothetical protein